jgi:hypothetical protein
VALGIDSLPSQSLLSTLCRVLYWVKALPSIFEHLPSTFCT